MEFKNFRVIKQVETNNFAVSLVQSVWDSYHILYGDNLMNIRTSEAIKDYGIASHLFDMKVFEFERNNN